MTWRWLDLVDAVPTDATGSTPVRTARDEPAGFLAWWDKGPDRPSRALRVDDRLLVGGSDATWLSWCRFAGDASLAFDDGAVSGALRHCLEQRWPDAASTLLVDWSRIAGAVTSGAEVHDVGPDPFARVFPRRLLRVDPGVLGSIPAPTGPGITRYGSGNPWPWDRYAGQVA